MADFLTTAYALRWLLLAAAVLTWLGFALCRWSVRPVETVSGTDLWQHLMEAPVDQPVPYVPAEPALGVEDSAELEAVRDVEDLRYVWGLS